MSRILPNFLFDTLRGRLILSVAAVHAVMMTLFIGDLTTRQRAMLLDRQVEEATALSRTLASSAAGWIISDDISGLQELVDAQRRYPEVVFAILADDEGRVLADTDSTRHGLYMIDLPLEASSTTLSRTPALVDVAVPAMVGGYHVGWARVGIGQKVAGKKLAAIARSGAIYAIAAILVGSIIAWFMGRRITQRLYAVKQTIDAVRSGNHLARSQISGPDEPAVMAREFNSMLDELAVRDAEVRTSEKKYRTLIHKIQAAVVVHGPDTRIITCNPMAEELLGLTEDQLLGKTAIDPDWHFFRTDGSVMPSDEYPVNQVIATGQPLRNFAVKVHRPHKRAEQDVWVLVSGDPVLDESGELNRVIVTFVDVTERMKVDEELFRLNRELRAISDCNQVLVRATDEQTLLKDICRIICDKAGYRLAWVGYAEHDDAKSLRPVAWAGFESGYIADAKLSWADDSERGRGPAGIVIRSGKSFCVQDFTTDELMAPWREAALQHGYRSGVALPLYDDNGAVFGVLMIYSSEPNAITTEEIRLLEELASDLALGITVLRTRIEHKQTESVNMARLRLLQFAATHTLDELLQATLDEAEALSSSLIGFYHFLDADQKTLTLQNWSTRTKAEFCEAEGKGSHYDVSQAGVWVDCIHARKAVIHNDYSSLPHRKGIPPGHARVVRELVVPVFRAGKIVAILGVGNKSRDYTQQDVDAVSLLADLAWEIAERKLAETALIESEKALQDAQQLAHVGNWELDLRTNQLKWSDEIYRIFDLEPQAFGATYEAFIEAVHPDDRAIVNDSYTNSLANRSSYEIDHRLLMKDGSTKFVHEQCKTFYDENGAPVRSIGTVQDVSECKLAEKEREALIAELETKNAELERFTYTVSHDLKSPLITISGFAGLLREHCTNGDADQVSFDVERIINAANKMAGLLDSLLEMSRIGRIVNPDESVNMEDLVRQAVDLCGGQIAAQGISVKLVSSFPTVRGDRSRLLEVVQNLLDNAVKYMGNQPRPKVEIGCNEGHDGATFHVKDNGIGIEPRFHRRVFELFEQLDPKVEGSGIGLSLAKRIIECHNGKLWVESEGNYKGSTFYFTIPHSLVENGKVEGEHAPEVVTCPAH